MAQARERPIEVLGERLRGVSPEALGAAGLASGVIALGAVILGFSSWMLLGTTLVVWVLCGWALFFQPNPRPWLVSALGAFLVLSAAVTALAVLAGLYLRALGPSWIL
jgi:hypothetical protein